MLDLPHEYTPGAMPNREALEKLVFLTDEPTSTRNDDQLEMGAYADVIAGQHWGRAVHS